MHYYRKCALSTALYAVSIEFYKLFSSKNKTKKQFKQNMLIDFYT